jgi:hypothetical protein
VSRCFQESDYTPMWRQRGHLGAPTGRTTWMSFRILRAVSRERPPTGWGAPRSGARLCRPAEVAHGARRWKKKCSVHRHEASVCVAGIPVGPPRTVDVAPHTGSSFTIGRAWGVREEQTGRPWARTARRPCLAYGEIAFLYPDGLAQNRPGGKPPWRFPGPSEWRRASFFARKKTFFRTDPPDAFL